MRIEDQFPSPGELLQLEPEEVAVFLLKYLDAAERGGDRGVMNRYNLTLQGYLNEYAREKYEDVARVLTEAWVWLQSERMLAPRPGEQGGDWVFITRRGKDFIQKSDLQAYKVGRRLPEGSLDPSLARKVRPQFMRGDYEVAVFQAFKEVEIRVRTIAELPQDLTGVALMRRAFDSQHGPLTDMERPEGEREATAHLFAGAIGLYKNPSSHRDVNFDNPDEAIELILFANHLLRLVDSRVRKEGLHVERAAR